jgi:hypothetical protein
MPQSPEEIAARLGVSVEFGREHQGFRHRCVDSRFYNACCIVADPECHKIALWYMRDSGVLPCEAVAS